MTITISSSSLVSLGLPPPSDPANPKTAMEPSGLAVVFNAPDQDSLFMVSDNGGYARIRLPYTASSPWLSSPPTNLPDHSDDYECVTFAGNTQLVLIGVEGYRDPDGTGVLTAPRVRQFSTIPSNTVGAFGSYVWTLTPPVPPDATQKNSGMEALTYVPNNLAPSAWVVADTLLVLMAVQAVPGKAYLYALPVNQGATKTVRMSQALDVPAPASGVTPAISELYLDAAAGILYVLYDDKDVSTNYLQALRWTVSRSGVTLTPINVAVMPWKGCEGMAVYGNDLFFSTDDGKTTGSHNGVYQIPGFIPGFINPSSR